jgi:transcriptional regulator with PAS, ATPase and Fis domain
MDILKKLCCAPGSPLSPIKTMLPVVAQRSSSVLITGETGTGKEVLAQMIHTLSPRREFNFVSINCAALPKDLLESELFGHKKGAFTGAMFDKVGKIQLAAGGTLFLDEIGEMDLQVQSKLLRVLQEKSLCPLGSHQEIPVDFRLITATHRNLNQMVEQQLFRMDLFFRIRLFQLHIAPLRKRPMDLPILSKILWNSIQEQEELLLPPLSLCDLELLSKAYWPGNIRQLRNVLERFAVLYPLDIPLQDILQEEKTLCSSKMPKSEVSAQSIQDAYHNNKGNQSLTAKELGISRGSLQYQLRKMGMLKGATSSAHV